jgi:hypothetical protein
MAVHGITSATLKAQFQDVQGVIKDLDSVALGLGRKVTEILRSEVQPLVGATRALTPVGPGPRGTKDRLPHMRDTITGGAIPSGMAIRSSHPAAAIFEYAGSGTATIQPRGVPITIRRVAMAHRAAEAQLPRIERDAAMRIGELLSQHGL